MSGSGKVFTLAQVSHHSRRDDCWLAIGGKVYDVTKFLDEHPGGEDVLLSATGKDATQEFKNVGHSTAADTMMYEFCIGDIDTATVPFVKPSYSPPKETQAHHDRPQDLFTRLLKFVFPLLILFVAVTIHLYHKPSPS